MKTGDQPFQGKAVEDTPRVPKFVRIFRPRCHRQDQNRQNQQENQDRPEERSAPTRPDYRKIVRNNSRHGSMF